MTFASASRVTCESAGSQEKTIPHRSQTVERQVLYLNILSVLARVSWNGFDPPGLRMVTLCLPRKMKLHDAGPPNLVRAGVHPVHFPSTDRTHEKRYNDRSRKSKQGWTHDQRLLILRSTRLTLCRFRAKNTTGPSRSEDCVSALMTDIRLKYELPSPPRREKKTVKHAGYASAARGGVPPINSIAYMHCRTICKHEMNSEKLVSDNVMVLGDWVQSATFSWQEPLPRGKCRHGTVAR